MCSYVPYVVKKKPAEGGKSIVQFSFYICAFNYIG